MAFQPAKCPNCGGDLQIPDDKKIVKCMYCGSEIVVREAINAAACQNAPNLDNLKKLADEACESHNYKDAQNYYSKILEHEVNNADAWFGRGKSIGMQSSLLVFKNDEMIKCFENAIRSAPDTSKDTYKQLASATLQIIAMMYYDISKKHFEKFISLEDSWNEYQQRLLQILKTLEIAANCNPSNKSAMETIVNISHANWGSKSYKDKFDSTKIKTHYMSSKFKKYLSDLQNEYVKKIKTIDPKYKPSYELSSGSIGCLTVGLMIVVLILVWLFIK